MHPSKTYVPQMPELGYTPEDDDTAVRRMSERLETIIRETTRRGRFCEVKLCSSSERVYLRVDLPRVTLSTLLDRIETAWILIARAVEFEVMAPARLRLNNTHLAVAEAA